MIIVFLVLVYVLLPIFIIYLTHKYSWVEKIGAIIIAYVLGIVLGHIGIFPHPTEALSELMQTNPKLSVEDLQVFVDSGALLVKDMMAFKVFKVQEMVTNLSIPIALPLLLFSLKINTWLRMSLKTLISMLLAIFGVVVLIVIGHSIFGDKLNDSNKIAGMLVGLYTGGTPNLAALKQSLGVDVETYLMTHTYDTAVGVIYLLFLITFGKNIIRRFLLPYPKVVTEGQNSNFDFTEKAYSGFFRKEIVKGLGVSMLVSILIFAASAGLGLLVAPSAFMLTVMLSITTLSIIASLIPKISNIEKSFELGMYFIIVFSLAVASMADISKLINISSALFAYITVVYFGALLLHVFLSKIFKVDADTLMVTSTALLCSPPFVPMVAGSLKNKEVIVSGITVGIMGYAIGNYLGALLASIL